MKRLPLSIGTCVLAVGTLVAIAGLQVTVRGMVEDETEIWQGNVTVTGWDYDDWKSEIIMKVNCDGKEGRVVRIQREVAAYLQNPQEPLYGTLYASGKVRLRASKK